MSNEALLELSHRYMRGEIAKPEYRQSRAKIIDQMTGYVPDKPAISSPPAPLPNLSVPPHSPSMFVKAGFVSAIIVATLVLLYFVI